MKPPLLDKTASTIIERNFYVDDLVTGPESVSVGIENFESVSECLNKSCFEIRKMSSNSMEVLDSVPDSLHEPENLHFDKSHAVRALGVQWNPCKEFFFFEQFNIQQQPLSKLLLLSDASCIIDPLGLLAPFVIKLKYCFDEFRRLELVETTCFPYPKKSFPETFCDLKVLKIPGRNLCDNFEAAELHFSVTLPNPYTLVWHTLFQKISMVSIRKCIASQRAPLQLKLLWYPDLNSAQVCSVQRPVVSFLQYLI